MTAATPIRNEVLTALEQVVNRSIDPKVEDNQALVDLGLDSLKVLEFVITLEQRLDKEFPEEDLVPENFLTIGTVVDYVKQSSQGIQSGSS